jgi:uncharacterized membrane protein YozB (DUF420 family)
MNLYLQPHGFLGTGASLLADIALLAYILLLVPGMLTGFFFARRKMFRPYHKYTMATILVINWVLIIFLMVAAYAYDVAPNIAAKPGNGRYLLPTIHGILGLVAQILGTYVVYRMFKEDADVAVAKKRGESGKDLSKYWFKNPKPLMRTTLTLWLATAVLGIGNYVIRYDLIPAFNLGGAAPVAPVITPEVQQTLEVRTTPEVGITPEVQQTREVVNTPEIIVTPEVITTAEVAPTTGLDATNSILTREAPPPTFQTHVAPSATPRATSTPTPTSTHTPTATPTPTSLG